MDESKVREIVNAHVKEMRWALQLQDWRINVFYRHLDGEAVADCRSNAGSRQAWIRIDNDKCDDKEEVLTTLRHELLHIFHAEMETYRKAVGQLIEDGPFNAVDEFFQQANEKFVTRIEQMLDYGLGMGVCVKKLDGKEKHERMNSEAMPDGSERDPTSVA